MTTTINTVIDRMVKMLGEPRTTDPDGYLAEMRKALAGWDIGTLDQAADRLIKTAHYFPRPAEIIEVCEDIASSRVYPMLAPLHQDWGKAALATADRLIRSPMGRQAVSDGWIGQLHDYCRKHGQLPDKPEHISGLKREALMFDKAYADCAAGHGGKLGDALTRLGATFLAKRDRLAQLAFGEPRISDRSRAMTGERDEA